MSVPESTETVLAAERPRRSTISERSARRAAKAEAAAVAVFADLDARGARFREVAVSQRAIAKSAGITLPEAITGASLLAQQGRIVFDRDTDTMQPYSYRIVR